MWPHAGYIVVVAIAKASGAGLVGVVLFQILLAAITLVAVFYLGRSLGNWWSGVAAASLLAIYVDLHRWHAYVLTESLYLSWAILCVFGAHRLAETRRGHWLLLFAFSGVATATTRANGWIVLAATAVWLSFRYFDRPSRRFGASAAVVVVLAVVAAPTLGSGVEHSAPAEMMREGYVLWLQDLWRHTMPAGQTDGNTLFDLITYVVANPVATFYLAIHRVGAALAQVRPYYSLAHNVVLVASLTLIYGSAIVGVIVKWRDPLVKLLVALIVLQLGFVGLTFADYDGRFGTYAIPWFAVLGGPGIVWIGSRIQERRGWRSRRSTVRSAQSPS